MASPAQDDESMNELVRERAYVVQNEVKLKEVFGGDYIAVYGNIVIASAKERSDIIALTSRKIGKRPVLVGTIAEIINGPIAEMPGWREE